jgi:glycosyltransferase involved in cell wall biosynthesis
MSISCVIPVFNGGRFLGDALDSVLAQTHAPREIIVVDDGSTDDTAAVAARYADRIIFLQQANAGPAAARNRGLSVASGDLIAFQDADDLWHPEKLAIQAARFTMRPELDVSITHVRNFWEPELREEEEEARRQGNPLTNPAIPGHTMQTTLMRRTAFDRVGALNPALRFGEDIDWFMRARDHNLVLELLPDVLVYRRFHRGNLTRRVQSSAVRDGLVDALRSSLQRRRGEGSGSR